jgi:Family of unknown function (DUF5683)
LKGLYRFPVVILIVFCSLPGLSQERDTLIFSSDTTSKAYRKAQKDSLFIANHSPRRASIYSAVLPGLGQLYNRKYWKVPIVYAGFGGLIYGIIYEADHYTFYKEKYKYMLDNKLSEYEGISIRQAEVYKDFHRRWRDLFSIGTAGFYALQIIDATVDAYLIDYDISEDIALRVEPTLLSCWGDYNTVGIKFCLSF